MQALADRVLGYLDEQLGERLRSEVEAFLRERVRPDGWSFTVRLGGERGGGWPCALGRTRAEVLALMAIDILGVVDES